MLTCQKCGYRWQPRLERPKCCPECKSREWGGSRKGQVVQGNVSTGPKVVNSPEDLRRALGQVKGRDDVEMVYDE